MTSGMAAPVAASPKEPVTGADDPVLLSKITVPRVPGWAVRRPQIDRLLAKGVQGPLTLVTGPPGSGKSMAIALWAAARSDPATVVWVTLDDYDNRPKVFWSYVVAALRRCRHRHPPGFADRRPRYSRPSIPASAACTV